MTKLTSAEHAKRRALDFDAVQATMRRCSGFIDSWTGYTSIANAEIGRASRALRDVAVYQVEYRIKSPVGPDRYHEQWLIRFDCSAPNYPLSEPAVFLVSRERPWIPHSNCGGVFCLGSLWNADRTVAHLILDVARMLNFDEELTKLRRAKAHYNVDSISWWENRHKARAITPIRYPEVIVPAIQGPQDLDSIFGG